MTRRYEIRPRGPYSLALTLGWAGDATRRVRDGILSAVLVVDGNLELTRAGQRPDGTVVLETKSDAGFEQLRFVLAVDDDHGEFLRRFAQDPLLGEATRRLQGLRKLRTATVAQALLRALCGQLIESHRARSLEARIVRAVAAPLEESGLYPPPTTAALAAFSPAELRAHGLHARRSAALVRICRSLDLERLRELPAGAAADWIERERGLGPWSAGVVCLEGLGRHERGLQGDLGLMKLLAALRGRWVEPEETRELLAPYGEWAGLASVYLLKAFGRGLIPLPHHPRLGFAA